MEYDKLASDADIEKTIKALAEHNIEGMVVNTKEEALAKIKELIPAKASIMNGASVSLEQIGFVDYLKSGQHHWDNLHLPIFAEKDKDKQRLMRKHATVSDFYLGSAHALTETGEMVIGSNTASQLPGLVYNAHNVILVVGSQKIVPTLADAMNRLETYVVPLEDEHMQGLYKVHTQLNKELIFRGESAMSGRKIRVLIVKEKLGF